MAHPVSQKWFLSSLTNEPVAVNMTVYMFPLQYWLLGSSKHLSVQTHGSCSASLLTPSLLIQIKKSWFYTSAVSPNGNQPIDWKDWCWCWCWCYSLEGLMLKLKLQYFGHLMRRVDSLEKTMMLGKWRGGEGSNREWGGWMALPTQWT